MACQNWQRASAIATVSSSISIPVISSQQPDRMAEQISLPEPANGTSNRLGAYSGGGANNLASQTFNDIGFTISGGMRVACPHPITASYRLKISI